MINNHIQSLILKYHEKDIVIDTNLLILYLVGNYKIDLIPMFNRTHSYTKEDYLRLKAFLSYFNSILTTPNILTEVSNLSASQNKKEEYGLFISLQQMITLINEQYIESITACSRSQFAKYGLTDAGIIELATKKYTVLTDDFPLYGLLEKMKVDVINFNHIRGQNWLR